MLKPDPRHTLPRRLIHAAAKSCVAIGALVGAANWAAKGYPPAAPAAPAAVAARAPLALDEPVTTGSIAPRGEARPAKAAAVEKPAPEKIVARVPDFDSRALAALAAGTPAAQAATTPTRKEAARKDAARKDAPGREGDQARR